MGQSYPILDESTQDGDEWVHKCGTVLIGKRVNHSIHDGPFALSGGGRVHVEIVPYCPACEDEPSAHGVPLREDPVDASEREILRRMGNRS